MLHPDLPLNALGDLGRMMCRFHSEIFRPVSAVRPSSVTDNLRARYHAISGYDIFLNGIGLVSQNGVKCPISFEEINVYVSPGAITIIPSTCCQN